MMTHPDDNEEESVRSLDGQSRSDKHRQQEQKRLSLQSTPDRLSKANTFYDVSKFEAHLPVDYSGYLIRSRRRLEMEGLRQRRCLADCHQKIMTGDYAIATVFVGGQRWSVEMVITGRQEAPIRIVQICSRFNQLPCRAMRNIIHEHLGIPVSSRRSKKSKELDWNGGFPPLLEKD